MSDLDWDGIKILAIGFFIVVCFTLLGFCIGRDWRENQAIEHHAARYHPQTGQFEWIERAETGGTNAAD